MIRSYKVLYFFRIQSEISLHRAHTLYFNVYLCVSDECECSSLTACPVSGCFNRDRARYGRRTYRSLWEYGGGSAGNDLTDIPGLQRVLAATHTAAN